MNIVYKLYKIKKYRKLCSRTIIQKLEELSTERQLNDKIELNGSFCMGECSNGVCVKINDELFSVSPETVNTFFENEVLRRL